MVRVTEEMRAAVGRVVAGMGRRFPRYRDDLAGAAWVKVLAATERGQLTTPERVVWAAYCGVVDFLRAEKVHDTRWIYADARDEAPGAAEAFDGLGAPEPTAESDADVRRALARLTPADRVELGDLVARGIARGDHGGGGSRFAGRHRRAAARDRFAALVAGEGGAC